MHLYRTPHIAVNGTEAEAELRRALSIGEIVPYFQPLVQVRNGVLSGFEVLARWLHPVRGMVAPDDFIPLAERAGLIGMLTETILLQAFAATAALQKNVELSVNISPIQLRDPSLPQQIRRIAEQGCFPLNQLTIEITESALLHNLDQANSIATELKRLGVRLALDDFGTGYSSLRHLQALPFDEIKVDHSFVNSMIGTRESRKIVAAVIGLGQSLGLVTVAEGVEDRAQADMLQWLGCERGQGWLYGRAVPAAEIPNVLCAVMYRAGATLNISEDSGLVTSVETLPAQRLAQCQAIYDGAPVGLCLLDRNFRYMSINQRLADMNNATVCAHLGRSVAELTPQLFAEVEPYLLRALNGEAIAGVEARKLAPSGSGYLVELVSYQPARDEAGEVIGISVSVVDITERKLAEDALVESEDHYRRMVQSNPQTPWIMDANGMNVEVSPRWEQITGMSPNQTRDNGWLAALPVEDVARIAPLLRHCLRSGDPLDIEYRVRAKDGVWRWMRSRGKAQRGENGEIVRWYGSVEDIDNYKKVVEALRECEAKLRALEANQTPILPLDTNSVLAM
jgi:PAS domain S-box-containing protein